MVTLVLVTPHPGRKLALRVGEGGMFIYSETSYIHKSTLTHQL